MHRAVSNHARAVDVGAGWGGQILPEWLRERPTPARLRMPRQGHDGGARLLGRIRWPSTRALFCRAGLHRGMHCLDVGCGRGDGTLQIARMVGPQGYVVGIDADEAQLAAVHSEAARERLRAEFRTVNPAELDAESQYDLVCSRFFLAGVPEPAAVVERMLCATRPGGVLVVEDIDVGGHFCHPPCTGFDRYVELYGEVVRRAGGDPSIGLRLPAILHQAGVEDLHVEIVQPAFWYGDGKLVAQVTMAQMRAAVVDGGLASHAEVDAIIAELEACARDPRTVMSTERVVQTWGRKPPAAVRRLMVGALEPELRDRQRIAGRDAGRRT